MVDDDAQAARNYALSILAKRAYTVHEVRDKLMQRETPAAIVNEVIATLLEYELLNDADYAAKYVEYYGQNRGPNRLRQELQRRGVGETHIQPAMQWFFENIDQEDIALQMLLDAEWRYKPAPKASKKEIIKARKRAWDFLARRGYEFDIAAKVLASTRWFDA